ncbi:MAG: DUF2125 domain-containing protein [Rhizobiales bacterium]|nr:DUF2125 domain-containing protein [Hyphomicrobiales bacterium]
MATDRIGRRRNWRYLTLLILFAVLFGGWSWLWHYASGKAEATLEGWRAREAKSGRDFTCGTQTIGGYPFRIEVNCNRASALLRSNQPPVEIKSSGILIAAQIYQPTLLISEFHGPLTIADLGQAPNIVVNWKLARSSVRGTPAAPERVSLVFDRPVVDRVSNGNPQHLLVAKHIEIHGRIVEGSAANKPVIQIALQLAQTSAPGLHPAAETPVDADITGVLRGLNDFAPKPWPVRFRELQAAGGQIDITQARLQQGETIAVGSGSLSLNPSGRLEGQLRVTVAGIESFLNSIDAQRMVQASPTVDKLSGALDRLLPGLGNVARQQAGANIATGINLLGEQTTLEGKRAVALPLRFDDGRIFLGPIPIGNAPALF